MIRKLFLREAATVPPKKAMTNIVRRGVQASPPAEQEWGDALLKAVDDFDIEVRDAGSGGKDKADPKAKFAANKKAQATGKKPAADQGADDFFSDYKKQMGSSKKDAPKPSPASSPKPADADLEDDWFTDDSDKEYDPKKATRGAEPDDEEDGDAPQAPAAWGTGHNLPKPRSANSTLSKGGKGYDWTKADPDHKPGPAWDQPDPNAPASANFHVGADDSEEEYRSPFGATGFGGSSWQDVPDWMRDPEKMPMPGGGSRRVPTSQGSAAKGPSPVGRPWSEKDAAKTGDPDAKTPKKGLLGRLFGRNK